MKTYSQNPQTPLFVYDSELHDLEKELQQIEKDFKVQEIEISFKNERIVFTQITNSDDVYSFVKDIIGKGMDIQEQFIVLYLNTSNKLIGYYKHTVGTINSTQADIELISAVAIKTLAKNVIIAHNHPSGNKKPSEADKAITKKLKDALKYFEINLIDHIIATSSGYYSLADESDFPFNGLDGVKSKELERELRENILVELRKVTHANSPEVFERIQTKDGYRKLESVIIQRVISQQIIPAAIIPQLEMEYTEQ